jgi:hypothetical protein
LGLFGLVDVTALSVKNFASLPIMFSPKEQIQWRGLEARACVQLCDSKVLHIVVTAGPWRRTKACAALLINPKLKTHAKHRKQRVNEGRHSADGAQVR